MARSNAIFAATVLGLSAITFAGALFYERLPIVAAARVQSLRAVGGTHALPAGAYYARCADTHAAGTAPLYRSEPGYRASLDADGDRVACELFR